MNFIENVINALLDKNLDLSKTNLILPSKRPIIFFKKYFAEQKYNGFIPAFFTIEDFISKYSDLIQIENIPLWFEAYKIQKEYINPEEKFEDFLKWIPTLLNDFNDIETFSDHPLKIIEHLSSIERIENWGESLNSQHQDKLFFKNIKFWENNLILYKKLTQSLKEKGLGTKGMLITSVVENLKTIFIPQKETFVFVGFNALTPKEEKIIKYFISNFNTFLYWDADSYYLNNPTQEAGYFLRNYLKWNYYASRDFQWIQNNFKEPKIINVISTSQEVTQAKYAGNLLNTFSNKELKNTALILCDETILPSVIESLPKNIQKVNITMGYSLKNSLLASFFKQIFQLHIFKEKNNSKGFYFEDVINILTHSIINSDPIISNFVNEIKQSNRVFISDSLIYNQLSNLNIFFIFKEYSSPIHLLIKLKEFCEIMHEETKETEPILKENFLRFKNIFSQLIFQLGENPIIDSFSVLQTFYHHVLNNEKIDFIGEPLEGLQLMGLLESRLLSFKNIIMLGVNEGILPAGKTDNSFIPFDVKKNYNINTYLENDAIYAYHFYRLLQHAENITLLYNNYTEGINSGEKSRFISQLQFESGYLINEIIATYSGNLQKNKKLSILKTPALMKAINEWLQEPISPTHLTNYHYNPINFYIQKILHLEKEQEIEEEISPLNYGNLIHHTLESLYSPYKEKQLSIDILEQMLKEYPLKLNTYINQNLNKDLFERGHNYLQKLLAEKTVEKIILKDITDIKNGNTIFIKDIEKRLFSKITLDHIGEIHLKGFVDRWDIFNGQNRIIDYKTSTVNTLKFKYEKIDKIRENNNYKFFIQLIFYAYMILNEKMSETVKVGIWSFKKPFKGLEILSMDNNDVFTYSEVITLFKNVTFLIEEIANPNIPFSEKD